MNEKQIRNLKLKATQKRIRTNPTSEDVPGVAEDGVADGVAGMFSDVAIDTYVVDDKPRLASLMNVNGIGADFKNYMTEEEWLDHAERFAETDWASQDGLKNSNDAQSYIENNCKIGVQICIGHWTNRKDCGSKRYVSVNGGWSSFSFGKGDGSENDSAWGRVRFICS